MRPLPRVLALTDERIAALPDLGVRAAALAAAGPSLGLVARLPSGSADMLSRLALRLRSLARPPMAQLLVTGRSDIAAATGATGVILRRDDLRAGDARVVAPGRMILASVHSEHEAREAIAQGVDGLIAGTIWTTASHPGRIASGLDLLRRIVALGTPVWAIGGVTSSRAEEAQAAGAWGVCAIRTLWDAADPYRAALELMAPWSTA